MTEKTTIDLQDAGRARLRKAVGTDVKSRVKGGLKIKSRITRGKYQDSPEWVYLGNGAGMKKHLMPDNR